MDIVKVIGLVAGFCTTIAFLPQVIKTWRSRSAKDISLGMFLFFVLGVMLWLVYGVLVRDLPIILANGITLILAGCILFFKVTFKD
ncbi:Cystinosin/ERS1p repeat protein [Flammeovirgaceae bacterium 311]|nr:Cystinosin/ERS1p repeat protein [Flammeovirgaceae bacterium 311]